MMRFKDRIAVVTGASSGIGRAVGLALARRGTHVALLARRRKELDDVVVEAIGHGVRAISVPCDVSDPEAVTGAIATVEAELGSVDILVNCAGFNVWRPFAAIDDTEHRRMMDVNYWGTFHCIRAVLPGMRERKRGAIVNVAAGAGKLALPVTSGFSASKAAVGALSEALRRELLWSGVAVSCLFPASVRTDFWDEERVSKDRVPPVVRWSPKMSPAAVARNVCWTIRWGFAQRTFPVFLALTTRLDAMWPRLGDLILSRWGLPALLGVWLFVWLFRRVLAG